eukprot:CAMPEP_0181455046 /NCGR_PEP_ID=MMETSP1110-20121109/30556_1 /TAXON_ID=174948 /ORGANISM="Symbiodinium sp., Strain CCMP421" /LENGTH=66 /DNA_ID=CAMNT_0023579419 /DNA_START=75 /DNA_END=271 /DNA_ORIENTATION=-
MAATTSQPALEENMETMERPQLPERQWDPVNLPAAESLGSLPLQLPLQHPVQLPLQLPLQHPVQQP